MRIDFIKLHLVSCIRKKCNKISRDNNYQGFIWLNSEVINATDGKTSINRLNERDAYESDKILPISYYLLKPKALMAINNSLKRNKIYLRINKEKNEI